MILTHLKVFRIPAQEIGVFFFFLEYGLSARMNVQLASAWPLERILFKFRIQELIICRYFVNINILAPEIAVLQKGPQTIKFPFSRKPPKRFWLIFTNLGIWCLQENNATTWGGPNTK